MSKSSTSTLLSSSSESSLDLYQKLKLNAHEISVAKTFISNKELLKIRYGGIKPFNSLGFDEKQIVNKILEAYPNDINSSLLAFIAGDRERLSQNYYSTFDIN